jgi:hypothetical protein
MVFIYSFSVGVSFFSKVSCVCVYSFFSYAIFLRFPRTHHLFYKMYRADVKEVTVNELSALPLPAYSRVITVTAISTVFPGLINKCL